MVILHNRMKESPQITGASWGEYMLSPTEFSYRYTEPAVFTITTSAITLSRKPFWEGMRTFDVLREGTAVRLKSKGGSQEFLFSPSGLVYTESSGGNFTAK